MATSHSATDENSYVPVKFQKNTGRIRGKLRPQDRQYTLTGTITNEPHSFWRNPLWHTLRHEIKLHNKQNFSRNVFNRT